ncbi:hypothetical protein C8J56DRAFT_1051251 [Mycena floridula]|nr:hypothetical protein C8J56DRAFT_1051251 [Mycena floridula]
MTSFPSQFSEDVSDATTSAPFMTCIQDDQEFIGNARERNMTSLDGRRLIKGRMRVALLWWSLRWLPSSLRTRVFLELLQGSYDREDIWLWNEGDEVLMEGVDWSGPPPPWTSAAAALERRLARTPAQTLRRKEVQFATLETRAAMIVWLALTSTAYKRADKDRGGRNCEECNMLELIDVWHDSLPRGVREWFDQHSERYDDRAFTEAMDQAGHSCHKPRREWVTWWLFMRSELFPTQQDHIIYLRGEHCVPCLAHKPTRGSDSPPSWTPSPALVALRCIWDDIAESRDFFKWLRHRPINGFKEANGFLSSLPRDTDEDRLEEWQAMDSCIETAAHGGSLNIRSWCMAMCWRMMPDGLSYPIRVEQFIHLWNESHIWHFDFLPPLTPVPEFRDAIRDSGHTCWQEEMDNYAAAVAFLNEDPEVVGIDVQKDSRCQVCRLQWRLRSLGETLPVEEPVFKADLTELLDMLQTECSRRNVSWNNILASVQHHDVHGPILVTNSLKDLHYTLDNSIGQGHSMRTDHIDLNVPHCLQRLIPQAPHLTQDITKIFHPDIDIVYVQHNSNGLQHSNYSMTPMANPITNGTQGQDSRAQYPVLHDIQLPSYTTSTRSGNVNYSAYGQSWIPYDQPMVQDLEVSQTQVSGRRSIPLLISELVNSSVEDGVTTRPRVPGAAMTQDEPATGSVEQDTTTDEADLSKDYMIEEIETFFTESFERLGVELHGTKRNEKLPWLQFDNTLEDEGIEIINWPEDVLTPGKGSNSSKGLAGVPVRDLKKIYKAIHSDTAKLELRHIPGARKPGQAVSQQEFFVESSASGSRKRPRDAETDGDSRPKKLFVFKNIRFDGVMEAWKVCLYRFLELSLTLYRTD